MNNNNQHEVSRSNQQDDASNIEDGELTEGQINEENVGEEDF